jgi:hypothetical protein
VKRPKESIELQDKWKSNSKKIVEEFTYGKQSKRPLRFYGGAIFLSGAVVYHLATHICLQAHPKSNLFKRLKTFGHHMNKKPGGNTVKGLQKFLKTLAYELLK